MTSSTSSSEKSGFQALLAALAVVVAFELVLHLLPRSWLIGYTPGINSYYEVRHHIEDIGHSEIAILGSSRGREAIIVPELTKIAGSHLGRPVTVSNYSIPDANAVELLIEERLLENRTRPALLIYLVSPRILRGEGEFSERDRILLPTLGLDGAEDRASIAEKLSEAVSRALENHYLTYRHRFRFRRILSGIFRGRIFSSPIKGGLSDWQKYSPERARIVSGQVNDETVARYVAGLLDGEGRYTLGPSRITALEKAIVEAREAGTEVVVAEVPLPDLLQRNYPPDVTPHFHEIMGRVAAKGSIPFVTVESLGVSFGEEDFREQSHLNYRGAFKFTGALAGRLAREGMLPDR